MADLLAAAGRRRFIGRAAELAAFRAALEQADRVGVLWLSGLGGVGKTALMQAWADDAERAGRRTVRVDARAVAAAPQAFATAVASARGPTGSRRMVDVDDGHDLALFIDTYERLTPLDGWIREEYLPGLPVGTLIAIAGRQLPSVEWSSDQGWGAVLRVLPLRNFRPEESRAYLTSRGVPELQQPDVLAFTHGNPLALSLLTDLYRLQPEGFSVRHPDVIRALVRRLLDDVPTPQHRRALEVCAHLRVTTEDRLADALMVDDAGGLFEWLRSLSFVESGPAGIFPHDLTREVIETDLRWRNPERYRRLHDDVRRGIVRQLQHGAAAKRQAAFSDLLFLHRDNPIMRPLYQWDMLGHLTVSPATPHDHELLCEIVRRQQGSASEVVLRHWLHRQPERFVLFRDAADEIIGFACMLELTAPAEDDRRIDPAVNAAMAYAANFGPCRADESVLYCRWALSRAGTVPTDSPGLWEAICMTNVTRWVATPRLSWSFVAIDDFDRWAPFFEHIRQPRAEPAEFTVGGRGYAVFAHDWRAEPALMWLREMADRELTTTPIDDRRDTEPHRPILVLSQPEFEAAVRQALRDYARPDRLAGNALLSSRLVADVSAGRTPVETLRQLVRLGAEELNTHPRDQRLYRALYRTFLNPAATHELAAEVLGLPFSTYRAHLRGGIKRVSEMLWQRELYGAYRCRLDRTVS